MGCKHRSQYGNYATHSLRRKTTSSQDKYQSPMIRSAKALAMLGTEARLAQIAHSQQSSRLDFRIRIDGLFEIRWIDFHHLPQC
jgi:hypothetical protein